MTVETRPNIILITIDCLRADHVGCYGYEVSTTPNLDQLAAKGTLFAQAISQGPGTTFAFPSIMSSTYSSTFGGAETMSIARPLVAENLQRAGYTTAAFVSNPYLATSFGYNRGFDVFDECYTTKPAALRLMRGINRLLSPLRISVQRSPYPSAERVTTRACTWLNRASTPFFLWIHYMDVHWPYNMQRYNFILPWDTSKRVMGTDFAQKLQKAAEINPEEVVALRSAYDRGIQYVDHHVGQLLDTLEIQGLTDKSWLVVTADHGEAFGEHGEFFHTRKLYDELLRVPLILHSPGDSAMQRRVQQQVRHIDIVPTILDIVGLPKGDVCEGNSLLPFLQDPQAASLPAISEVTAPGRWSLALRRDDWKLILHLQRETCDVVGAELYNLGLDPGESKNLCDDEEQVLGEFQTQLLAVAASIRAKSGEGMAPKVETDEEVTARLRALGYLE